MTSAVLLQRFLTGLWPEIGRQLLLREKPANFAAAVKDATAIEYVLEFGGEDDSVHTIERTQKTSEESNTATLVDTLTKRLESLELAIQQTQTGPRQQAEGFAYNPEIVENTGIAALTLAINGGRRIIYAVLSFKLQSASPKGGRQLASSPLFHHPRQTDNSECYSINTILRINSLIGHSPVTILLDSGTAMSVIRLNTLPSEFRDRITEAKAVPVGANGTPLWMW